IARLRLCLRDHYPPRNYGGGKKQSLCKRYARNARRLKTSGRATDGHSLPTRNASIGKPTISTSTGGHFCRPSRIAKRVFASVEKIFRAKRKHGEIKRRNGRVETRIGFYFFSAKGTFGSEAATERSRETGK